METAASDGCRLRLDKDTAVGSWHWPWHTHTTLIRYSGNYIPHVPVSVVLHLGNPSKIPLSFRVFFLLRSFLFAFFFCEQCINWRYAPTVTWKWSKVEKKTSRKKRWKMRREDKAIVKEAEAEAKKLAKQQAAISTMRETLTHTITHRYTEKNLTMNHNWYSGISYLGKCKGN